MRVDSLNIETYSQIYRQLKTLTDNFNNSEDYSILYLVFGVLFALYPAILKVLKRWFKIQKESIIKDVKEEVTDQHKAFKDIIRDQVQTTKDTVEVVKESVQVIKEDNKIRKEQHDDMMGVMNMHIEELTHVKTRVDDHEERITGIEKG